MGSIYIAIILLCRVAQHLCNKRTSNMVNNLTCFMKYNTFRNILSGFLGLALIVITGNGFKFNLPTFLISVFSGLMLVVSTGLSLVALKSGTVALASMFGTAGLLIPCIAGIFLFDKPVSPGQWIGIILFFAAAYLLISSSKKIYGHFSVKTLFILIGIMLTEGFTMLSQQAFGFYAPDGDVSVFSFLSFGTLGIIMLAAIPLIPKSEKENGNSHLTPYLLALGSVLSVAVFIINQLATLASSIVPPVILFTFINGGSTIIGSVIAALCFKEKFTIRSITGIILGVTALIIIKAF